MAKGLCEFLCVWSAACCVQEGELKMCTHSPQTTKLPAFIRRLAREFAADPERHPEQAGGLISPRSEDEGLGHLFTILQPEWH